MGTPRRQGARQERRTPARLRKDRIRQGAPRPPSRSARSLDVRRLKEAGADCIKILLYYTPTDPKHINDHKHAWVERLGDECRANDIPFFLEFVGYEEGVDEKGLEFAKKKPEIVTRVAWPSSPKTATASTS